jgi:hypothetical protein
MQRSGVNMFEYDPSIGEECLLWRHEAIAKITLQRSSIIDYKATSA